MGRRAPEGIVANWTPRMLSYSAVDLYCRCPAAYHRRYVAKVVDPPSAAMAFGRVMAKALEALHRGDDAELTLMQEYTNQIQQHGIVSAPVLTHGLALLRAYCQLGVPSGAPEQKFTVYLPDRDAVPVEILGYMDLATPTEILEFKCSGAKWDQGKVDSSMQAALYRYAYLKLFGRKPECVRFIILNTRRVEVTELRAYPAGPELRFFEMQAAATWRGIRDGRFEPKCKQCPACEAAGLKAPPRATAEWEMPDANAS